jgi:phage tail sheath protein FI
MAEQLAPGLKITRRSSSMRTIQGVGTSTGAFEGAAERGPIGVATLCTRWADFVETFGTFVSYSYLAHAVKAFFDNGGSRCYVVRAGHYDDVATGDLDDDPTTGTMLTADTSAVPDVLSVDTVQFTAASVGTWANWNATAGTGLQVDCNTRGPYDGTTHFSVYVYLDGDKVENFEYLNFDDTDSNYCETQINGVSKYITITDLDSASAAPDNRPSNPTTMVNFSGGVYEETAITDNDYIGDSAGGVGIYAFDQVDEINLISVPGITGALAVVQKAIISYAEARSANADGVFAVCDPPQNYTTTQIRDWRIDNLASSYAALFWPWLQIKHPVTGRLMYIPPSGHVQGKHSEVAQDPGIWQSAAGVEHGRLNYCLGLQFRAASADTGIKSPNDQDLSILNPVGVNSIVFKEGSGFCIWGVRTMTPDSQFKYISVQRFFLYVEESIEESMRWVVFKPNDTYLWKQIELTVKSFLYSEWRSGRSLKGDEPDDAYFVTCDESNNPTSASEQGKLYVDIGMACTKPAEFVEFRVGSWEGGASVEILKRESARDFIS